MSVGKGVRIWCRGQKSGQLCPILLRILSILQHVFQKNSFSLETDHFHPVKQVVIFGVSLSAKGNPESVGAKLGTSWSNSSQ